MELSSGMTATLVNADDNPITAAERFACGAARTGHQAGRIALANAY